MAITARGILAGMSIGCRGRHCAVCRPVPASGIPVPGGVGVKRILTPAELDQLAADWVTRYGKAKP